jgi:hypothetical protein
VVDNVTAHPKDVFILIPETCECCFIEQKKCCRCDLIKALEVVRSSCLVPVGPKCHHVCPHKRKAEDNSGQMEGEEAI